MQWHAHAEEYPLLEGDEYEDFKADIAAYGVRQPIRYRVVDGKEQGLDGRNRHRVCAELKIDCPKERVEVADAQVPALIDSLNLHRRHLSAEQRRVRAQAMRANGQSVRKIANTLHVSKTTVQKDLASDPQVYQIGTPENKNPSSNSVESNGKNPSKVTGRDGKLYPANQPRTGADCIITRNGATKPEPKKKTGRAVFDDRKVEDEFGKLTRLLNDRREALGLGLRHKGYLAVHDALSSAFDAWHVWQKEKP